MYSPTSSHVLYRPSSPETRPSHQSSSIDSITPFFTLRPSFISPFHRISLHPLRSPLAVPSANSLSRVVPSLQSRSFPFPLQYPPLTSRQLYCFYLRINIFTGVQKVGQFVSGSLAVIRLKVKVPTSKKHAENLNGKKEKQI